MSSERYGRAALAAITEAEAAADAGDSRAMQRAVLVAGPLLDRCEPEVLEVALHRLMAIARRCQSYKELDELLARMEAWLGPCARA